MYGNFPDSNPTEIFPLMHEHLFILLPKQQVEYALIKKIRYKITVAYFRIEPAT